MLGTSCQTRRVTSTGSGPMKAMKAGVTKAGKGIDNIVWNILGQTYTPKQVSESSFSWHALFPPGTFVPPHVHANQDEFIYVLEGRFDLFLDGKDASATAGDLIRMPMQVPHGIFKKIDNVPDPAEVTRLAGLHDVTFLPPPDKG